MRSIKKEKSTTFVGNVFEVFGLLLLVMYTYIAERNFDEDVLFVSCVSNTKRENEKLTIVNT